MDKKSIEQARFNMIEQQIRPAEVLDTQVLEVITEVPREAFVAKQYAGLAFSDTEIPLEHGHVMMKPIMEARTLQALTISKDDNILEIGTGSGYLTALLAKLGKHVTSVEIHESLQSQAKRYLSEQNITNVELVCADGCQGWTKNAPYDAIAVTGSIPLHTNTFESQLCVGGRLFVIEGDQPTMSVMLVTRISDNEFQRETLFETVLEPLENVEKPKAFVF